MSQNMTQKDWDWWRAQWRARFRAARSAWKWCVVDCRDPRPGVEHIVGHYRTVAEARTAAAAMNRWAKTHNWPAA